MTKFFVLYCTKNLLRPKIYKTLRVTGMKKQSNVLAHEQFSSQIEAEQFGHHKVMQHLRLKQEMKKQGIDLLKINSYTQIQHLLQKDMQKKQTQKCEDQIDISKKSQNEAEQTKEQVDVQSLISGLKDHLSSKITQTKVQSTFDEILSYIGGKQKIKSAHKMVLRYDQPYFAFFDGSSKGNPGISGAGYLMVNNKGNTILKRSINLGYKTNNQAEFMSLLLCLLDCKANNIKKLKLFGDSQLVVKGMTGQYNISDQKLQYLNILSKYIAGTFEDFSIEHIKRQYNKAADKLSNEALKKQCLAYKKQLLV